MSTENSPLVLSLAEQVDVLSGQVAALMAIIASQPSTNTSAIEDAKGLLMSLTGKKVNPGHGSSPQDSGLKAIGQIESMAQSIGIVRGAGGA